MPEAITGWHAHVYYDPATRAAAEALRAGIAARFPDAVLGRWHDRPVGPHPSAMYQVAFAPELLPGLLPVLALHRAGLDQRSRAQQESWLADLPCPVLRLDSAAPVPALTAAVLAAIPPR